MLRHLSLDYFHSVGDSGQYHLEAFLNGFGAARQVDDEAFSPQARHRPAQYRHGRFFQRFHPHRLGKTGGFLIQYGKGRLRSNVPPAQPGAPGGQNYIHLTPVSPSGKLTGDSITLVGDDFIFSDSALQA